MNYPKHRKPSRFVNLRHRIGLNSEYTFREAYKGTMYVKFEFPHELISNKDFTVGENPVDEDGLLNEQRWRLNKNQVWLTNRQNRIDKYKLK